MAPETNVRMGLATAAAGAAFVAFVAYGGGRTMCETIGFDRRAAGVGLFVAADMTAIAAGTAVGMGCVFRRWPRAATSVCAAALGATAIGWILLEDYWMALYMTVLAALPALLAAALSRATPRQLVSAGLLFVGGLLGGSALSEAWILRDEAHFADEVSRDPGSPHGRGRAWPNSNAALVYWPGEGTHATD